MKIVTAIGMATAVMFEAIPLEVNLHPSSFSNFWTVFAKDKSVLNILQQKVE